MGKYIKLFQRHSQYLNYLNSPKLVLPNVSYCEDVLREVHYNPIPSPYRLVVTYYVNSNAYYQLYNYNNVNNGGGGVEANVNNVENLSLKQDTKGEVEVTTKSEEVTSETPTRGATLLKGASNTKASSTSHTFAKIVIDGDEISLKEIEDDYYGEWYLTSGEHIVEYTLNELEENGVKYAVVNEEQFLYNNYITRVEVYGACAIGSRAFKSCEYLTAVTLPVQSQSPWGNGFEIGLSTFEYCYNLQSINVEEVTNLYVGDYAFCNCNSLPQATMDYIENINSAAVQCLSQEPMA